MVVDVLLVGLWLFNQAPWSVHDLTLEVGSPLPAAQDFATGDMFKAEALSGLDAGIDMNAPGDHEITFRIMGMERTAVLHVVDTTPPAMTVHDVEASVGAAVRPEDFITSLTDATAATVAFVKEPDVTKTGVQQVRLRAEDAAGNAATATASLNLVPDTEPPVISGVKELTVEQGGSVSYKRDVTVTDNCDPDVQLEVDNSAVDLSTPGTYPVIYRATDSAGNTAEATTTLYVVTPMPPDVSEDAVWAAANTILGELFPNGIGSYSQYDVISTLYWYCHDQIAYVDSSNKDNWVEAAYSGLVRHQGDCYVYAMSSKVLLTAAGIPNRDIAKIPNGDSLHYWNLVDIGEGWHHFDTTRRADGSTFFYLDDVQLMQYSNTHNYTHAYDYTVYTGIVGEESAEHRLPPGIQVQNAVEAPAAP